MINMHSKIPNKILELPLVPAEANKHSSLVIVVLQLQNKIFSAKTQNMFKQTSIYKQYNTDSNISNYHSHQHKLQTINVSYSIVESDISVLATSAESKSSEQET